MDNTGAAPLHPEPPIASVAVYCSASAAIEAHFGAAARTVGAALGRSRRRMVFGGGGVGLMGESARACKEHGGRVVGVSTATLIAIEGAWEGCDELVIADSMPERRTAMMDLADAFVVLPGGLGTYEELFEVLVGRQLGDHGKPIAVVDHGGFYRPLLAMIEHGIAHRFIAPAIREALVVVDDAADALPALLAHRPREHDPADFLFLPAAHGAGLPRAS